MNTQKIVFEQDNKQVIQQGNHFFTRVTENGEPFESGDFNTLERAKASLGILSTITENNKLLAEFLGFKEESFTDSKGKTTKTYKLYNPKTHNGLPLIKIHKEKSLTKYSTDWNWLMEVVEKIDSLSYDVIILHSTTEITSPDIDFKTIFGHSDTYSKIESVYNACLDFIKWYNENLTKF
jgi:hypothetical protein